MWSSLLRRACAGLLLAASCCGAIAAAGSPGVWLDVPFVKQDRNGCGAASIAMVMQYWQQHQNKTVTEDTQYANIERALLPAEANGVLASNMKDYFQQHGYAAFTFAGDLTLLEHHLRQGRPLIVALQPGFHLPLHYVVVAGVSEEDHLVLLNDPAQRKLLKQDEAAFEKGWKATGNWTLLAVPGADPR